MLEIIEPALDKVMIDFALEKTGGKKQEAAKEAFYLSLDGALIEINEVWLNDF